MITSLKILEKMNDPESREIIRLALQSDDKEIARQAARSLEHVIVSNVN